MDAHPEAGTMDAVPIRASRTGRRVLQSIGGAPRWRRQKTSRENTRVEKHRRMARCRCDRVRRRSRCVHHLWPPWKSPHAKRCPVIYSCFIPCVALYELRITTLQTLPLGRPDRCRRLAARQPSDASPMDRRPHLADETFGGEECAAENCEREKNTCRRRARNIFSSRRGLARAIKLQPPR